jgi:hypothetical protein
VVEAQRDAIKADVKGLETVGRAMVDQLRKEVNVRLAKSIENPIRRCCKEFVAKGEHLGPGTKGRILELIAGLAEEVTETASGPAEEILLETFREVENEILEVFKHHANPLDAAGEAIVEAHETYVKRSDAQRRRQVLAEIDTVLEHRSQIPPDDEWALAV